MRAKLWRIVSTTIIGVAVVASSLAPVQEARAASGLLNRMIDVMRPIVGGDQIQMLQFAIVHPSDAAIVYGHAASQDYPFFALVAAAKAAKNRTFPKIGKFDYNACVFPVTSVDAVFSKADQTIDGAKSGQTHSVVEAGKTYAADAAKAGTQQAKQQLNDELMANVPYYGEIRTICTFAFETDFAAESQFAIAASGTWQKLKTAYQQLSSGDVTEGVETLIKVGLSTSAACDFVDKSVGGGLIGKTPILGDLALGACKGFAGVIIDGINGIVVGGWNAMTTAGGWMWDAGKAVACTVVSLVYKCKGKPAPPAAVIEAQKVCKPAGGIQSLYKIENGYDQLVAICGSGMVCRVQGGKAPFCQTAAERAAIRAKEIADIDARAKTEIPKMRAEFLQKWPPQCPAGDAQCRQEFAQIIEQATVKAFANHAQRPEDPYYVVAQPIYEAANNAPTRINDANFRVLPVRWRPRFEGYWSDKCEDDKCRGALKFVGTGIPLAIRQRHDAKPFAPYAQVSAPLYTEADQQATKIVAESVARAASFNKETTKNASEGWETLAVAVWSKQCLDAQCVDEVKALAEKMKYAARLLQLAYPNESSLSVQGKASKEYGPKFHAAVDASKARAAAQSAAKAPAPPAASPSPPQFRPRPWPPATGARPAPSQPDARPAPNTAPAAPSIPRPGIRIIPRVTPGPTPSPTPTARPLVIRRS